jgi:hypothetical protein
MMVAGFHNISHLLKGFATKAMSNFCECKPLCVSEPQPGLDLSFQDPVFCRKILISQKKFLVHCPSDIGQYTHPPHINPHRRLELISQLYVFIEAENKKRSGSDNRC